ncbi:Disease resistance RPP8-like protein 3 [Forsythia ovata]|uniref:Disease resistance RPP8-like protein 3 n=1 Tax=Forsythia ovata TaxID=205694 RepID=A0ABD1TSG4_9LAMI
MAYAALLSLTQILEQTLEHDYQYLLPVKKQQIESLLKKVNILREFLKDSTSRSSNTIEHLERRIRDAARKAEAAIESHITHSSFSESASHEKKSCFCLNILKKTCCSKFYKSSFTTFDPDIEKVMKELDSIKQEVKMVEDEIGLENLEPMTSLPAGSSKPTASGKSKIVGLDDDLMEIKTRLTRESQNLETISIVGMGGIGKSTLAKLVYDDLFIMNHFYIRVWVTVSQEYSMQKILLDLLDCMKTRTDNMREVSNDQLADTLYKYLKGRRYLVVLDDVWDTRVWDDVNRLFPNDKNGSRVILTTRLENVAIYANSCPPLHRMNFLNEFDSWKLFCDVFENGCCPLGLSVGKEIVQNCQGLPLAVVVIAGLISKDTRRETFWSYVAKNLSSVITSNDEQCSKILYLSYNNLPHHLIECFLYMGVFPEDFIIPVSILVKLWIAEGLLKSVRFKNLEDVAEEYLLDLVKRNLVLVGKRNSKGKIKTCKIHDLVRDLCINEAKKEKFFHVANKIDNGIPQGTNIHRLSIQPRTRNLHNAERQLTASRSILDFCGHFANRAKIFNRGALKVLHVDPRDVKLPNEIIELVNLEYLNGTCDFKTWPLESIHKLQNLETLILRRSYVELSSSFDLGHDLPPEIWKMSQLRHVSLEVPVNLPEPLIAETEGETVLENLRTLSTIYNFKCAVEVLRRIPNVKKLGISYDHEEDHWCFYNLVHLCKLETLKFFFSSSRQSFLQNIIFPPSLRKLTLINGKLPWNDMTIIGSLPNLQVLKLKMFAFTGREWEPNEGEFLLLKFLLLEIINLEHWRADSIHFPSLEHLVIFDCHLLQEIPSGIGAIPTLQSIELYYCNDSVVTSAKQIQEEQLDWGNDDLRVLIVGK